MSKYQELLQCLGFHVFLLRIDMDWAQKCQKKGCPICRGTLHCGNYERKPRGVPETCKSIYKLRLSFCCASEECRKRLTPSSVRFLGRKIFVSAAVLLMTCMLHGVNSKRAARLRAILEVDRKTIQSWRKMWTEELPQGPFWIELRGLLRDPLDPKGMPQNLLEVLRGTLEEKAVFLLKLLAGLGARSGKPP